MPLVVMVLTGLNPVMTGVASIARSIRRPHRARGRAPRGPSRITAALRAAVCTLGLSLLPVDAIGAPRADFGSLSVPAVVRQVADGVLASNDHHRLPFIMVDKVGARIYVLSADGRLQGSAAVLVGLAIGDRAAADIGQRPLDRIAPPDRITPAGRFEAERGFNLRGEDVIWVDYDSGLSMHRVRTTVPGERRLRRLATSTAADNRISYGCINLPVDFYERIVAPAFSSGRRVVYILPELGRVEDVFGFRMDRVAKVPEAGPARRLAKRSTVP